MATCNCFRAKCHTIVAGGGGVKSPLQGVCEREEDRDDSSERCRGAPSLKDRSPTPEPPAPLIVERGLTSTRAPRTIELLARRCPTPADDLGDVRGDERAAGSDADRGCG